jgi:hypothetical protein
MAPAARQPERGDAERRTRATPSVYAANQTAGALSPCTGELALMQSARPGDLGALVFAIGVLLVLFVVPLTVGSPLT